MKAAKPFTPFFVKWYCHDVPEELLGRFHRGWKGKDVLEAGCGGGSLLFDLADSARAVHGVDISVAAVDFLSRNFGSRYDNVSLEACDFSHFDSDRRFDLIISNDCFEHVEDPLGFIRTACSVLRMDGTFCLQFPNELDHGINHFDTLGDLDGLIGSRFRQVEYFEVRSSAWHDFLHGVFALIRKIAAPGLAKNRQAVLSDPETRGLDDFARSSCFTWIQEEAQGGFKFQLARMLNSVFRALDKMGPSHRVERLDSSDGHRSILGRRLVVVAQAPGTTRVKIQR